jgi:hypothetical protein
LMRPDERHQSIVASASGVLISFIAGSLSSDLSVHS